MSDTLPFDHATQVIVNGNQTGEFEVQFVTVPTV